MFDRNPVTEQVIKNCHISDARYAGLYSICGLALRLRDLYKWEKSLEPWVERESPEILEWIGEKEEAWERLADKDFSDIVINGDSYDLFDAAGINARLEAHGLFYGAGYIHSLKPTFFLAPIEEMSNVDGHRVYILGRELARDLLTVPALSQDRSIVIRKESGKLFLWNQIMFLKKSGRQALGFALEHHGLTDQSPGTLRKHLGSLFFTEMERYIYHELGEIEDRDFDRNIWREIIGAFPHTPIELLARSVKDLLADTNQKGPLRHIVRERNKISLGFYVAFLDGLASVLFPEMQKAFSRFVETRDWTLIEHAVSKGYRRAKDHAKALCTIFSEGKRGNDLKGAGEKIEKRFLTKFRLKPSS
ncbi:MAG: hypothetical protein JSV50_07275 [Desulfobacteraceae bacterium]|nr:MAG: hypothetical protein JSV50_07275 [Desulfobacteraceae bacterium]